VTITGLLFVNTTLEETCSCRSNN